MNFLLLERVNILNIIILIYLIAYSLYCAKGNVLNGYFLNLLIPVFIHVVSALITEITVNSLDTVSPVLNYIGHFFLYVSALVFGIEFCRYVLSNVVQKNRVKQAMMCAYTLGVIGTCSYFIFDIKYMAGNGTNYSIGTSMYIICGMVYILLIVSNVIMIRHKNNIDRGIILGVLPVSILCMLLMFVQIFVHEFLITSSIMTILAVAVFFSVENPVKKLESRATIDYSTGVYNRNCYEIDYEKYEEQKGLAFVVCDLNYLKCTNDTYGHREGDKRIALASSILQDNLVSAYKIYRTGGDEFIAVYKDNINEETIETEINAARESCKVRGKDVIVPLEIAMGYAVRTESETLEQMIDRADLNMYKNKSLLKKDSSIPAR